MSETRVTYHVARHFDGEEWHDGYPSEEVAQRMAEVLEWSLQPIEADG